MDVKLQHFFTSNGVRRREIEDKGIGVEDAALEAASGLVKGS